jgi:CBS domain-containing protein
MTDYTEQGAVPVDDAGVEDPPTAGDVAEQERVERERRAGDRHVAVRDVMMPNPLTVRASASVVEVAAVMRDNDVGDVLVADGTELRGILTDRDIVVRSVALGVNPAASYAGDCCSPELHTVDANDPVGRATEIMSRHALRRVPVLEEGQLVGIVTLGDVAVAEQPGSLLADIAAAPPND